MRRRHLLLGGVGAAGVLFVGWGLLPPRSRLGRGNLLPDDRGQVRLNGWITLRPDGDVVLAMARAEMGQGVHTALPMLVAEELDVPLSRVHLTQAGPDAIYGSVGGFQAALPFHPRDAQPDQEAWFVRTSDWLVGKVARELGINTTGGSTSVSDAWPVLRLAAATARASLLGAASLQWRVPRDQLTVHDGVVHHASGLFAGYGELAAAAAVTPPGEVRLKARADWRLIGQPAPRVDVPAKVDGTARFGIDARPPDLVFAAVRLCPILGGAPGRIDERAARALPGVERVVRLPPYADLDGGVAVIGRSTWHAMQGARALDIEWRPAPARAQLDSAGIETTLRAAAARALDEGAGQPWHARGDIHAAEAAADRIVEATYVAPYLAHLTMEPVNATAQVHDGKVTLWLSTQVPGLARNIAASVAGVDAEDVTVHELLLGGGFGRRLEVDMAAVAVRVAMEAGGRPVQVVWPREEDVRHDYFRPAGAAALRASLAADGTVTGLRIGNAGDATASRWAARTITRLGSLAAGLDKSMAEGLFDQPYGFAHQHMATVATRSDVPVGYWRSVGHSHHAFFIESFIDELAHAVGADPLVFRRRWLADAPRHRAVLDLAAAQADWSDQRHDALRREGRALGLALHESFGSIVAQVAEVSLDAGQIRVHRVHCAIDCGTVVNPDIVAQQMEGSVVFGLTAALYGGITIRDGVVQESNVHDQPLLGLAETPHVFTHIVPATRPPTGVGEPGVPPIAPAVANAVFRITGQRLRRLPL